MKEKKFYPTYLVVTLGFALALVVFFGLGILNPLESTIMWSIDALGTFNITMMIGVLLTIIVYMLRPGQTKKIKGYSDILLFVFTFINFMVFIFTMSGYQEAWYLGFSWFIRNFGYAAGVMMALAISSGVGSVQILTASYGRARMEKKGVKANLLIPLSIIIVFALFVILIMYLWKYSSLFNVMLTFFIATLVFSLGATYYLVMCNKFGDSLVLNEYAVNKFASYSENAEVVMPLKKMPLRKLITKIFSKAGYNPKISDIVAISLIALDILALIVVGIYGIFHPEQYDFGVSAMVPGTISFFEIYTLIIMAVGIIILFWMAQNENNRTNKDIFREKGIQNRFLTYPYLSFIKAFAQVLAVLTFIYYFTIVVYLPDVWMKEALFVIVGAIIYFGVIYGAKYLFKKIPTDIIAKVMNALALVLFLAVISNLRADSIANGYEIDSGVAFIDLFFPFEYIHSWAHCMAMGIIIGIILSNQLYFNFFRGESFSPKTGRVVGFHFAAYMVGLLCVGICFALVKVDGAGDWPPVNMTKTIVPLISNLLIITIVIDLINNWHIFKFKNVPVLLLENKDETEVKASLPSARFEEVINDVHSKKFNATLLVGLIVFCLVILTVPTIAISASSTFSRDVVASGDGYFIWTTDSYEKVMPNAKVIEGNKVDAGSIDVARNEYGAVQIVWSCDDYIPNITADAVIAQVGGTDTITDYQIRLVGNIYGDAYPEILYDLDSFVDQPTLTKGENNTFWFNFWTKEDQTPGVYEAKLSFKWDDEEDENEPSNSQDVIIRINVAEYKLSTNMHISYRIPYADDLYSTEYYAKRHIWQSYNVNGDLISDSSFYDTTSHSWNFNRPLTENQIADNIETWGFDATTGMELWDQWAEEQIREITEYGKPYVQIDYYSEIMEAIEQSDGKYWKDDTYTEFDYDLFNSTDEGGDRVYKFYYWMNRYLATKQVTAETTLLDYTWFKWHDEFEQSQFFCEYPNGDDFELEDRTQLFTIYQNELATIRQAKIDALDDLGISYTTTDPSADNYIKKVGLQTVCILEICEDWESDADLILPYIDTIMPLSYKVSDEVMTKANNTGTTLWMYCCVQPWSPYANVFGHNQLYETHVFAWQLYQGRMQGCYFWRSDYRGNQYFYGFNGWLDGTFVYYPSQGKVLPTTDGSFYSGIRLETACESIEEYEFFIMLEKMLVDLKENGNMSEAAANELIATLKSKVDECASQQEYFTEDYTKMQDTVAWARNEIASLTEDYYSSRMAYLDDLCESSWDYSSNPLD